MKVRLVLQHSSVRTRSRKITFLFNLHPAPTQDAKKPEGLPEKVSSRCREG
jgi:hypothetical protein